MDSQVQPPRIIVGESFECIVVDNKILLVTIDQFGGVWIGELSTPWLSTSRTK